MFKSKGGRLDTKRFNGTSARNEGRGGAVTDVFSVRFINERWGSINFL
jgi:hypothetical protein